MSAGRVFFMIFSGLIAFVGLLAAAAAHDYLQVFGLGLMLFGILFAFGCIKRHYDEAEGKPG
ncbi:MAG: hypothetical protein K2X74_14885 [Acetobacteraceae bacterium]|nr:hypothetical protein [Acetobacteraceae bacterium]